MWAPPGPSLRRQTRAPTSWSCIPPRVPLPRPEHSVIAQAWDRSRRVSTAPAVRATSRAARGRSAGPDTHFSLSGKAKFSTEPSRLLLVLWLTPAAEVSGYQLGCAHGPAKFRFCGGRRRACLLNRNATESCGSVLPMDVGEIFVSSEISGLLPFTHVFHLSWN